MEQKTDKPDEGVENQPLVDNRFDRNVSRLKLSPEFRDYVLSQREAILKVYPKAFDPNLTTAERMEMERRFAEAEAASGVSAVTVMNTLVFSLIIFIVGVLLYREYDINLFYVFIRLLHYLIDPGNPEKSPGSGGVEGATSLSRSEFLQGLLKPEAVAPAIQIQDANEATAVADASVVDAIPPADATKIDRTEL